MPRKKARDLLAANMKRLRAIHEMTGDDLAEKAGLTSSYIRQVETGYRWVSPETLDRIAKALKVPVSEMFLETQSKGKTTS